MEFSRYSHSETLDDSHNGTLRDFHNETLHDRFRGALLGLSLASTAPCPGTDGLTQPMLKAAVPKLLRYHDSWEQRWHWVRSSETFAPAKSYAHLVTTVQVLILGDFLEMVLCDRPKLSGFTHLAGRSMRYDLPTEQQRYYQETLQETLAKSAFGSAPDTFAGDAFVGGIASALRHVESYGLSVQMAAKHGGLAPAIAGFLAGARGGVSSLPVLWQMRDGLGREDGVKCSEVMAIADGLFNRWSGIQRSDQRVPKADNVEHSSRSMKLQALPLQ